MMARKFLLKGQIWIEDFWRYCQCLGRPDFSLFIRSFWPLVYFKYSVLLFNTYTYTHTHTYLYMFSPYSLWFAFYQKYSKLASVLSLSNGSNMVVCLTRRVCALLRVICQHELQMFQGQSAKSTCPFGVNGETFQFKPLNLHKDLNKQPKTVSNEWHQSGGGSSSISSLSSLYLSLSSTSQLHHPWALSWLDKSAGGSGEALTWPSIRPGWSLLTSHHVTFAPHMYIVKQLVKKTVIGFWRVRHGNLQGLRMWAGSGRTLENTCCQNGQ